MPRQLIATALFTATTLLGSHAMAQSQPVAATAANVSIGGIGPGVDTKAFNKVKLLIADAVYKGTIDYFDVQGYGKEGGFQACVEKGRFAAAGSFETLLKSLKAIKPNPSTTAYQVEAAVQCVYPVVTPTP